MNKDIIKRKPRALVRCGECVRSVLRGDGVHWCELFRSYVCGDDFCAYGAKSGKLPPMGLKETLRAVLTDAKEQCMVRNCAHCEGRDEEFCEVGMMVDALIKAGVELAKGGVENAEGDGE